MAGRYLTDLADVARRSGYPVIEIGAAPGQQGTEWRQRARRSGGYLTGRPNHVLVHHTASPPSADGWPDANYCTFRSDARPVCNLYLARTGTIFVCAAGATNTNGSGFDPCGITPDDSMNTHAIGVEAGNNGIGEEWSDPLLDCYPKLVYELEVAYGIGPAQIHGHWEYAPTRKIDPAGPPRPTGGGPTALSWNMDAFRYDVAGTAPPTPTPTPPALEEDDMTLLLQCNGGPMSGALAVATDDLSRMTFLSSGDDYTALKATGRYATATLSAATFERIPGAEQIDVLE